MKSEKELSLIINEFYEIIIYIKNKVEESQKIQKIMIYLKLKAEEQNA